MTMAQTENPSSPPSHSHEFSFIVSLEPSFVPQQDNSDTPEPLAGDLSPADDIFLHGHLLPLRLLSHLPSSVPPRHSSDSFSLPTGDDLILDNHGIQIPSPSKSTAIVPSEILADTNDRRKYKSKSFSLFGNQKGKIAEAAKESEHAKQSKRKIWFDVGQVRQAFKNMAKPFSFFRSRTDNDIHYCNSGGKKNNNTHSSGNISVTTKNNFRQVMKRASPTNSRIRVADIPSSKATNDSTMEELQAAIQGAIMHCKNSIAKE